MNKISGNFKVFQKTLVSSSEEKKKLLYKLMFLEIFCSIVCFFAKEVPEATAVGVEQFGKHLC